MDSTLVRDWMTLTPYTAAPDETLMSAYRRMKECEIRRMPVVDADNRLVGIVTLSDIRAAVSAGIFDMASTVRVLDEAPVASVMTSEVVCVSPQTSIRDAAQLMFRHAVGGLPVVSDGLLVGIFAESDLFRFVMMHTARLATVAA